MHNTMIVCVSDCPRNFGDQSSCQFGIEWNGLGARHGDVLGGGLESHELERDGVVAGRQERQRVVAEGGRHREAGALQVGRRRGHGHTGR